ncbi:AAA family ATPase [Iningainema tapete]|uniref:histidine kinase n=1 Tax=Iningainema tapete BLCC-T55 TaxID=2748662 RepID=A0A8J6XPZ5_9CYAN|nr:AAA family ATPase [Iningainema tapete]MBD2777176.1 AAA family ATPase [Iningainema tapete BLCC-T55]
MTSVTIDLPGYRTTNQLYAGTRTLVYQAIRQADQYPVVLKLLRDEYPTFGELVRFRNQYVIAQNLAVNGVVKILALEQYRQGYVLVMEDVGGISLSNYIKQLAAETERPIPLSISDFVIIAVQLAQTLSDLHRHRVIHKDLKPANILIQPQTKHVKLIDFSISSLLPKETQEIHNPNFLEGTLAYLSPEQTGRMNRGIDYRSDFYSLGVTFYELLTGQLPFVADDPMELMHCHIARLALPVAQVNPLVPPILSEIVAKLMAKNAEDRYQNALGLKYDLECCQSAWQETGTIAQFPLAQQDVCDRFNIPEQLYGREVEVQKLLAAFERVSEGTTELMLVGGFSGIGKTAIVNEVHKPIVRQRGYFIKGKFDQFNRNMPLSAFVQALRDLMAQLLTQADAQLMQWKTDIMVALGENAQVIIEVIPELEQIVGEQPPVPELTGSAAQNRFNLLFQKFIQVFTTPMHPLVIFLDDLQWADSASLNLMQVLMSNLGVGYLLLIGAYRDNEVSPVHPLMLMLEELKKLSATVNIITLTSLSPSSLNALIADTLKCAKPVAKPLTDLIHQKTKGNPFFSTQFLKALHEDGWIEFDAQAGHWQCDITQVRSLSLTDDVVEFMALQLQKLPVATQNVLKLAACIGNQFDLATLAIVSEQMEMKTAAVLWKALQEGMVIPQSHVYKFYQQQITEQQTTPIASYKFLHDRVQQAAYSLIPETQKKATHLKIGQLLLQNKSPEEIETSIFDIVNQLNAGINLITQPLEKNKLAQLNLIAGKKAKVSTAYKAAVKYFTIGLELLSDNNLLNYNLTLKLHRECAECEYLIGNFERAEKLFEFALNKTQDKFDLAEIYGIQMYLKMTQGENIAAAIEAGLKGLSIMGMNLPVISQAQQAAIETELQKLQVNLEGFRPADLFNLPEMTDPVKKVCMSLLADLWASAYMEGNSDLSYLVPLLMINLSLKYGNAESSGFAYCLYGMSLANQGNYQTAYEFGKLGLKLDFHFNSTQFIPKTNNIFAHTINPYNQHLKTNLPISYKSFQISQETGNIVFGVWAVSFIIWAMLIQGRYLADIYAETEKYLTYVQQSNDVNMIYAFTLQQQFLLHLQGINKTTDLLYDKNNQNDQNVPYIEIWRQKHNFEHGINWYFFLKLQLAYLYGRYSDAVKAAEDAEETLAANSGFFPIIQYYFYYPLSLAALYPSATLEQKKQYWEVLQQHQQMMKNWADNCPENFLHRYLLLSAEMAQISGKRMEAIDLYDRAVALAKEHEYVNEEALSNELAAKFYLNWGKQKVAAGYLQEAYYGYARWGALAKIADLETRYPQLLQPILKQPKSSFNPLETLATFTHPSSLSLSSISSTSFTDVFDFTSILKAAQAISSTIQLEELIRNLTQIILENSGAETCVLLLPRFDQWEISAVTRLESVSESFITQEYTIPLDGASLVPVRLIQYVKRTQKTVIIDDGKIDIPEVIGEYMLLHQPQSVLCMPILNQSSLVGVLYLEHRFTKGVFSRDRLLVTSFLCTQAAISLENARLYQESQIYAQQLKQSLTELQASQQRLQLLIQQTPLAVIEWDINFNVVHWNPAAERIFGYTTEEALGRHFQFLVPESIQEHIAQVSIKIILEQGGNYNINENVTKDGKTIICLWYNNALVNADGELIGVASLADDITERKQAEIQLHQKAEELENALQQLQQTQLQLIQSEKMSALGNLVAGVAHEINNPVGFISGNLNEAQQTVRDLVEHLNLYRTQASPADIANHAEEIDVDYLMCDLPKMIDSMKLGCDRINSISTSLRTFSRADLNHQVSANIHEGIDSTILILKHRLKASESRPAIEVVTDYGNIPSMECFPGQLNQVFMNILANAIDALEESNTGRSFREIQAQPNRITIKTELSNDCSRDGTECQSVLIRIQDNGIGMAAEVKQKIFDHLFTTKGVGKGTGLGLAIARQIVVEQHGGTIEVNSTIGEGTEFVIALPVKANL